MKKYTKDILTFVISYIVLLGSCYFIRGVYIADYFIASILAFGVVLIVKIIKSLIEQNKDIKDMERLISEIQDIRNEIKELEDKAPN